MVSSKVKKTLLVLLLIAVAVIFRFTYRYPYHPDHYIWGVHANAIIEKGYAPWVLHPMSLFGYYPLSVPSGFEYLSAYLSAMVDVDLPMVYFYFSIFCGLYAGLAVFVMMRHWNTWEVSFLSSAVLLTMAFFMKDTSNTASTRITNLIFYPLFILILFKIHEHWVHKKKVKIKYIVLEIILFLFMALIHRLSQLLIIFVLAFFCGIAIQNWKKLLNLYTKSIFFKKREKHYLHSKLYILVDILVIFSLYIGFLFFKSRISFVVFAIFTLSYYFFMSFAKFKKREEILLDIIIYIALLVFAKAADLAVRSRLLVHVSKFLPEADYFKLSGLIVLVLFLGAVFYFAYHFYFHSLIRKLAEIADTSIEKAYSYSEKNPERALSFMLFAAFGMLVFATFTGRAFFHIDPSPYYSSFILKGTSSIVVLVNWLMNINNNLTILIWFSFLGIGYLFLKKYKDFYDYFFIFVAFGFCQFIFDWEYIRLYMNPLYAVFIAIGLVFFIKKILEMKRLAKLLLPALVALLCLHLAFSGIFMHRDLFLPKIGIESQMPEFSNEQIIAAGEYIRQVDGDFSLLSSADRFRTPLVAYYAGKPDAVGAQSIFLYPNKYNITALSAERLWESFRRGEKIREFYQLHDWILPGFYYHGRHIRFFLGSSPDSNIYKKVLDSYKIKYIIDNKRAEDKDIFFFYVQDSKNKVYTSDEIAIFDIEKGQA
ncbi:hypothetical protein JW930_01080 [Candidatus Woesearchaeota archaeon]|nr:hypothetical protein [Candidatus Woesearchaeota archaeon]